MTGDSPVFFGCWTSTGHGYHAPGGGHSLDRDCTPWGYQIDSPVWLPRKQEQSAFKITHRDGWTVIACADYTVDHRGGSMAAFCFPEDVLWPGASQLAREHFPHVWARLERAADIRCVESDGEVADRA